MTAARHPPRSGLRRKCAAVTSWQAEISVADVREVVGILPPTVVAELLGKIGRDSPSPSPGSDNGAVAGSSDETAPFVP